MEVKVRTSVDRIAKYKIQGNLANGDYPTTDGFYITEDYLDGRINIEYYDSQNDSWSMEEEECQIII